MARPFCSTPLWDSDVTWNTESPDFTPCFENTVLVFVPNAVLLVMSPIYWLYLFRWRYTNEDPLPLTRLGAIRTILSMILAFLTLMNFFRTVGEEVSGLEPELSLYFGPAIQAIVLLWTVVLMHIERKAGVINSGPLFIYWLLLCVCGLAQVYSYAISPGENDQYRLAVYFVYYVFLMVQLMASCMIDVLPQRLTQDKKMSPEMSASFLSYLTFHWMNKLCWTGFRKTLTQEDIFKLHPRDMCETVVPLLDKTWREELAKKEKFKSRSIEAPSRQSIVASPDQSTPIASTKPNSYDATPQTPQTVTISIEGDQTFKPSLMKALLKAYGSRIGIGQLCKFCYDILQFVSPVVLQWMISYTQNDSEPMWHGYVYAIAIFAANLVATTLFHVCFHITMTTGMGIKAALISMIYQKALIMNSQSRRESTVGEIVNLMSVDTDRIMTIVGYLYVLWSAPFQIIVAMALLWNVMGTSTLAGVAVMIALIPINGVLANVLQKMQAKQMELKDKRIRVLTEIISGIKILKLYTWEPSFHERVKEIREGELILLRKAAYCNSAANFTWISAPYLVMLATFTTFIYSSGEPLTPDKAFVALSLFNILRAPLSMLPEIVAFSAQAIVSIRRIGRFLSHPDLDPSNVDRTFNSKSKTALEIKNGHFSWGIENQPTLNGINLRIGRSKLVAIVGPVGCGKSSLLSALLGDMERVSGNVTQSGTLAYVAQQAWIQNATIKDNILFGQPFDRKKYDEIIDACALRSDLHILPDGDATEIGEKGINLSGGQKQRVALARAVYQNRDIILMDDPLSAVDAHVGKHIFESVIGQKGVLSGKTRVLVTHGLHWLPHCDQIVVVAGGKITDVGTFQELLTRGGTFAEFIREHLAEAGGAEAIMSPELSETAVELLRQISLESSSDILPPKTPTTPSAPARFGVPSPSRTTSVSESAKRKSSIADSQHRKSSSIKLPPVAAKLIEEETKASGGIEWRVMKAYLQALGRVLFVIWLVFYLVSQGFGIFGNIWLTEWTSDSYLMNVSLSNTSEYMDRQNLYLGLYGMAAGGQAVFMLVHSIFYAISCVNASRWIHQNMLHTILHCALSFFDTTPAGRILNRFSKDCETLDNVLPNTLWFWMSMILQVLTTIFIIIYGFPLFAAFIVPLGVFYYLVQRFYIPTTRQLKRIESVTRSPIYNHFSETLTGVSTIRAFGEQNRFIKESSSRVDLNNTSYFASMASNRWLGYRLELIGNFTVFVTSMLAIYYRGTTNSSIVGLAISYSLQVTVGLTWLVRTSSDLESNFVSVERMHEYSGLPGEATWQRDDTKPEKSWPANGEIVFENYATRYRPGLQLVLNGISCSIKPGEKIGIVGRTGAGKSSLTLALFRLIEPAGGRIVIDNVDISKLGLHQLRSKLTILPQDPVVFSASIRHNLDPFAKHSDEHLWKALAHAGLRDFVTNVEKGLQHECGENGESLSVGQRQLLCLARALLNKTKVLVLDEATAAVDVETDEQIMKTIRSEFADCTVLTIAHRLHTVMDSDRVLVLDKGQIAEFDSPQALLANPQSVFASMAQTAQTVGTFSGDEDKHLDTVAL